MLLTLAVIRIDCMATRRSWDEYRGAFIHVLLVIALVLFLVSVISGRRTVV